MKGLTGDKKLQQGNEDFGGCTVFSLISIIYVLY
jgi:hypothetical protein